MYHIREIPARITSVLLSFSRPGPGFPVQCRTAEKTRSSCPAGREPKSPGGSFSPDGFPRRRFRCNLKNDSKRYPPQLPAPDFSSADLSAFPLRRSRGNLSRHSDGLSRDPGDPRHPHFPRSGIGRRGRETPLRSGEPGGKRFVRRPGQKTKPQVFPSVRLPSIRVRCAFLPLPFLSGNRL